jgi:protocatechuate 3,4-dioxygenase beta subunit
MATWAFVMLLVSCGHNGAQTARGDSRGPDTCDNPDAHINCSFIGMPANLGPIMRITTSTEVGEPLAISGTIVGSDSTPLPGVILYAYHTDASGLYTKSGNESGARKWHGRLHGWCVTDSLGRYEIRTVRPAPYPDGSLPAHVHAAVRPPGRNAMWITDFVFDGDPLVTPGYVRRFDGAVGSHGVVSLRKNGRTWVGTRDILIPDPS